METENEESLLRSVAIQGSRSTLMARMRAEQDIIAVKEALRESNERMQLALDAGHLDYWNWDAASDQLTLGPRAAQMIGAPEGSRATRRQIREQSHREDAERACKAIDQALAERTAYGVEYRVNRSAGGQCWIAESGRGIYAADGTVLGITGVMQDITERKQSEQLLRESEERYRTLFDLGPLAVYTCDVSGAIQNFNRRAAELWGRKPVLGNNGERFCGSFRLFLPDGRFMPHDQCPMADVLSGTISEARDVDVVLERPDGSRDACVVNIRPLKNQHGEITGAINCFYDITQRKRTEAELIEAMSEAKKTNLAKSAFLSSMSHELRTPLSAILGFAQLMDSAVPPPTISQKRSIDQVIKAGWYLMDLINEILDLALIESGKLSLSMEPLSLTEVMRECQAMIETQAQMRGIGITYPQVQDNYFVKADRTRLKQVLINLLSNAVKYNTLGGTIVVECNANTPQCVRLSVSDTGAGLSSEQLTQLFQPFNRLGQEASGEEGTGIGLVVCKRLTELMGGAIGAESTVGKGSMFWIELNLATAAQTNGLALPGAVALEQIQASTQLHTLLYVEDSPANLMLVEDIIARRPDIHLLSASNGIDGVKIALTSCPDVILMDINLPGISGTEAMQILAEVQATAHIPVVALSANAMPSDIEKGLEAGFFRYLTKPIKVNEFMDTLDTAFKFAKTQVAPSKREART